MKCEDSSESASCSKKGFYDLPEPFIIPTLDEKREIIRNTEFPYCANISNKYAMVCKLGQGTYGEVYKAREMCTRNFVALKKVPPNTEYGGIPLTSIREIRILQKLKHENIICLVEVCKANISGKNGPAVFYIALEYCEFNLEAILKEKDLQLTLGVKKMILKQLLGGLYFMHRSLILHRDIKAANLLITKGGTLKIADFGLARPTRTSSSNSRQIFSKTVVTLWYRAPELLLGERCYSSAIDMWSTGCVISELWTRSAIMKGSSEQGQLFLILQLCGSISGEIWPKAEKLPLYTEMELPTHHKRHIKDNMEKIMNDVFALDLLDKLLILDPEKRINAHNALNHQIFREEPFPESLVSCLISYQKIQLKPKTEPQREKHSGYVDHIY